MQVSKKPVDTELELKLKTALYQLLIDAASVEEVDQILESLLSETERVAVIKRLGIAAMLQQHRSYEEIKDKMKVSSATIATIQSLMSQPGMQILLDKININLLADQWTNKVKRLFSVFGKHS